MNTIQIESILTDYIRANLSPRASEREIVTKRYSELQDFLGGLTFQTGSYARHTSTRPINDLDVIYMLPETVRRRIIEKRINPSELSIEDILRDLGRELQKEYGSAARVEVQDHSVGIYFGSKTDFSIDVVPAQPAESGLFLVPETAHLSIHTRRLKYESKSLASLHWIKSDPKGYIAQAESLDKVTSGIFRKSAKFIKQWRRGCKDINTTFPLKSFHLEIAVTELLKRNRTLKCVDVIRELFTTLPSLLSKPQFIDRADSHRFIDEYVASLSGTDKSVVLDEHKRVFGILIQFDTATTDAHVIRLIEDLLHVPQAAEIPPPTILSPTRTSPAISRPFLWN